MCVRVLGKRSLSPLFGQQYWSEKLNGFQKLELYAMLNFEVKFINFRIKCTSYKLFDTDVSSRKHLHRKLFNLLI